MLSRMFSAAVVLMFAVRALADPATVATALAGDLLALGGGETPETVRIFGIDAPEPEQDFAEEAKAYVTEQLKDATIAIKRLTVDSLGIPVVRVTVDDDTDLAHALVSAGLAWWDRENVPDDSDLKRLAAEAITAGTALWTDPLALAPWDWRKSHGGAAYTYSVKPEPEAAPVMAAAEEEERPRELKLKGDFVTVSDDLTTMLQTYGVNEDVNGILAQHGVMWATDANGNSMGLTADVTSIPGAAALGFQQGDILTSVNGQAVTSMEQAMAIAGQIYFSGQGKTVSAKIIRGGRPVNIQIPVPKF